MSQPRLTAEFQPCATDHAPGLEAITHDGPSTTLDLTAYVLGLPVDEVLEFHQESSSTGKDLDHVAELVPGLVEKHAGTGGYDMLIEGEDIEAFFSENGIELADLTEDDLARLRSEYGTEPGAAPMLADDVPAAPGPR